jgi:HpcH/HpaI aldolase/citrate lyase family
MIRNPLRTKLQDRQTTYSLWVTIESPNVTELADTLGFDWVVVDMEHMPFNYREVMEHVRTVRGSETPVLGPVPKEVLTITPNTETREAAESLDEILSVPSLEAIFFGPAHLSATYSHLRVSRAMGRVWLGGKDSGDSRQSSGPRHCVRRDVAQGRNCTLAPRPGFQHGRPWPRPWSDDSRDSGKPGKTGPTGDSETLVLTQH